MRSEKVTFTGSQGEALAARLDSPLGPVRGYALFAHCFTCSKDVFAAARIASALAARGIAVLRFDFTGLGMSGGDFANTNFTSNVQDLVAAADFLRESYEAPKLLIGHSLGGAAVLAAAGDVPEAKGVATIGAPSDAAHVKHNFADKLADIERDGEAEVKLVGRTFKIRKQFLDDLESHRLDARIGSMHKSLIIFHSPLDNLVGIDNATNIFLAAKHPKSFVSLDKADHLLTRHEDAIYVADVLSAWATRFLPEPQDEAVVETQAGEVVVAETHLGKYQVRVRSGKNSFIADEPVDLGGMDSGPTPHEILLGALGACTAITLRMYAERKDYPVSDIRVRLTREEVEETGENGPQQVEIIRRHIHLEGDLDENMRERMRIIADKCPVHRTLLNQHKRIDTDLVD
ncbi:MAG: alpha/beta fold hydrolase [Rhizobiales bacterium]|nr:alpha/beta fold hydrolase [Hyphomicrobiales bacterium]